MTRSVPKISLCCAALFLSFVAACAGQDASNSRSKTRHALVTGVTLTVTPGGETRITISVSGPSKYEVLRVDNPRRLVLDFQEAEIRTAHSVFPARSPLLRRVRDGQFRAKDPAVARVVADLIGDPHIEVRDQPGVVQIALNPPRPSGQPGPTQPASVSLPSRDFATTKNQLESPAPAGKPQGGTQAIEAGQAPSQKPATKPATSPKSVQAKSQSTPSSAPTREVLGHPGQSTTASVTPQGKPLPSHAAENASPPPSSLQVFGYSDEAGAERRAYIREGGQLYTVREGESFAGRYKVLKLTPSLLEIENADSHTTTQFSFSSTGGALSADAHTLEAIAERLGNLETRLDSLERLVGTYLAPYTPLSTLPLPNLAPRRSDELLRQFGSSNQGAPTLILNEAGGVSLTAADGSGSLQIARIQGMPAWLRWSSDGQVVGLILPEPILDSAIFPTLAASAGNLYSLLGEGEGAATQTNYSLALSRPAGLTKDWVIHDPVGVIQKAGIHSAQLPGGQTSAFGLFPTKDGGRSLVLVVLPQGELARYDPSSRAVSTYLKGISAEGMDFSRDGEWLTYVSYPEGTLWRTRVDGKERLQLTFPALRASSPRWSPDGKQIAFSATSSGQPWSLYLVPRDGGSPARLTNGEHNEGDASWSPDGKALLYSTMFGLDSTQTAIYVLDLNTNRTSQLPRSEGMYSPLWSLDGRFVVASAVGSGRVEIFDFQTKNWTEIASLPATWKVWAKDGKYVYFDLGALGDPAIYRLRISDHQLERVANLQDFRRLPTFGSWFTLAPDGSLIMARETDSQEIFALDW